MEKYLSKAIREALKKNLTNFTVRGGGCLQNVILFMGVFKIPFKPFWVILVKNYQIKKGGSDTLPFFAHFWILKLPTFLRRCSHFQQIEEMCKICIEHLLPLHLWKQKRCPIPIKKCQTSLLKIFCWAHLILRTQMTRGGAQFFFVKASFIGRIRSLKKCTLLIQQRKLLGKVYRYTGCPKKNALLCSKAPRGLKKWATDESWVSFGKFRKFPV